MVEETELTRPQKAHEPPILLGYDQLGSLGITYSLEHLRRLEADRLFPKRVRLSVNRIAWMRSGILVWINERANARPAQAD